MIRGIDNGLLLTDLDGNHFFIKNLGAVTPPPTNLVSTTDTRLSDDRNILNGTVTNDSISDTAGIQQSKLNLHGNIPTTWLGSAATQAAEGNLVQPVSLKNQPNGYVSLNLNGVLPSGTTPTSGTGTLHTIEIDLPNGELTIDPESSGTTRTLTGYWNAQNPQTWFGNTTGASGPPEFVDNRTFPVSLIPSLDASVFVSGTFAIAQVPMAVGVGVGHAPGLLPNPGSTVTQPTAQPNDYLGRDMQYHAMKPMVSNQPQLPPPSITVQSFFGRSNAYINITSGVAGTTLFSMINNGVFVETTPSMLPLFTTVGSVVSAYAAKIGYNNSEISTYTVALGD